MLQKKSFIDLSMIAVGVFGGAILGFGWQLMLAKSLSTESYGEFMSVFYFITMFSPLCGLGLHSYWLRAFGEHKENAFVFIKPSINLLIISTVLSFLTLTFLLFCFYRDSNLGMLVYLLMFCVLSKPMIDMLNVTMQLQQTVKELSMIQVLNNGLRFFVVLLSMLVVTNDRLTIVVSGFFIATLVVFLLAVKKISKFYHSIKREEKDDKIKLGEVLKSTMPFALSGVFYLIYFQSDIIMLEKIVNKKEAGLYSFAVIFITCTLLVPNVIYHKYLLPKLHYWSFHEKKKFVKVYLLGNIIMMIVGVVVALLTFYIIPYFIRLLYPEYLQSITYLKALLFVVPIIFVATNIGSMLSTGNNMKFKVMIMGLTAFVNLIMNYFLIIKFGALGAAYSTVASNLILLIGYYILTKQRNILKI